MGIEPDELRKRLTSEVKEALMRENWHSHDARWFLKVSEEYGFDTANKLNKATLKSMAKTEMKRILDAIRCDEVRTAEDFARLADIACEVISPPPLLEWETRVTGDDSMTGIVRKCFVFEEVKRAGITGMYECACGIRHEGWLEGCGLKGDIKIVRSMMRGDPLCEISATSISRMAGGMKRNPPTQDANEKR